MSPKFVLALYYLLPFAVFGQVVITPNYPKVDSGLFRWVSYPENKLTVPGSPHFPATLNFAYDSYEHEDFSWPRARQEAFGRPVYSEPLSLTSMIRPEENKAGVSAAGALICTGGDDVFAYAHYGRTGKLIWRTSPIANNMMATRWSLANFSIFQRNGLPSISSQLR